MPKKTFKRVNHKDPYDRFMECSIKRCKSEDDLAESVYKKVGSGNKKWDRAYKKLQVCRTRKCKKEEKASGDWLRSL
jgi:hypothetical protein